MKFRRPTFTFCFFICCSLREARLEKTENSRIIMGALDSNRHMKWSFPFDSRNERKIRNDDHKMEIIRKYLELQNKVAEKSKLSPGHLGRSCVTDKDCVTSWGQTCNKHSCECQSKYAQHNSTHCLPGVLLGFRCQDHTQCDNRVPGSSCIQGYCQCGDGKVAYRRANCLNESSLGESCRTHSQCSLGTSGSDCKWIVRNVLGKCQCKPGMPRRGQECGPPGFALGAPCGKAYDCAQHVPGSICVDSQDDPKTQAERPTTISLLSKTYKLKKYSKPRKEKKQNLLSGICQCPKGYFIVKNGTRCVPVQKEIGISPVSLGKPCLFSSQCEASDPFTHCNQGFCDCLVNTGKCSSSNTGCPTETFQCISDGRCLSTDFVCDGKDDCNDGSDEDDCVPGRCSELAFTCGDGTCVSRGRICDGEIDCPDGADEDECATDGRECPATTFRCNNGQCIAGHSFCNAVVSCRDGSDESIQACVGGVLRVPECPFRCKNGRCRSTAILCSGKDGCGDNSDEENCSVCNCPKP